MPGTERSSITDYHAAVRHCGDANRHGVGALMDRADYAEPILRARAALQTAERLLMDKRPKEARMVATSVIAWASQLRDVCELMALDQHEQAQRDA